MRVAGLIQAHQSPLQLYSVAEAKRSSRMAGNTNAERGACRRISLITGLALPCLFPQRQGAGAGRPAEQAPAGPEGEDGCGR